ncbi:MAG: DNA-deoxyinosine glycosylase [Clostridiales bacterium]|nr:DNA-deoxyinosine glycosylase [Clostridiales bacterium]
MGEYQRLVHEFEPVWDSNSKILLLGSFPSVKSRELSFYYGHPQNRFWKVLQSVLQQEVPAEISGKKEFLLKNHIALWDVIQSCDIIGSSDASIKNVVPTELVKLIENSSISQIFVNGKTAEKLYKRYSEEKTGMKAIALPSTSPANAMFSLERLCEAWKVIADYL